MNPAGGWGVSQVKGRGIVMPFQANRDNRTNRCGGDHRKDRICPEGGQIPYQRKEGIQ